MAATMAPMPAAAQFSDSYTFLKAVRDADVNKAREFLDQPGSRIADTRDFQTGESALHIVVKRRDVGWINLIAMAGANLNTRDNDGNTPLALASSLAFPEGVMVLAYRKANVNLANNRGETPLILAVHRGDLATVRTLIEAGADPSIRDTIAGMSARDYAERDRRLAPILKVIDSAKPKSAAPTMGPS
jgi:ankyrin repeat protein